jgi:hypothetical protein
MASPAGWAVVGHGPAQVDRLEFFWTVTMDLVQVMGRNFLLNNKLRCRDVSINLTYAPPVLISAVG